MPRAIEMMAKFFSSEEIHKLTRPELLSSGMKLLEMTFGKTNVMKVEKNRQNVKTVVGRIVGSERLEEKEVEALKVVEHYGEIVIEMEKDDSFQFSKVVNDFYKEVEEF